MTEQPTGDEAAEVANGGFVLQLPVFEGPLDLLLHLLEERQLDITEVSLLAVTEQYLAHLRDTEHINLDALSDFISVGARLLLLKSRALLPRDPDAEPLSAEDEADPAALLAALQEYRRFRQAAEHLRALDEERRTVYRRGAPPPELPLPSGLDGVTLASLMELFREVLERTPEEKEPRRRVARERVRLADRVKALVDLLDVEGETSFRKLISGAESRVAVIVEFLAVLELIKVRYLEARQSEAFGDIDLVKVLGAPPPSADDLADGFIDA
jgi:segregation and condensation protein A